MVAFHFPPAAMSSGHLRTLGFARYLPKLGWDPIVLTARAIAYPRTAPIPSGSIPDGCAIHRALALDARRHFGIAGKYPGFLAVPDRWSSWWPFAVWQGWRLIRRYRVQAIWSTYPIMTAHCVAYSLHRITGLPWIADFRDPVEKPTHMANGPSAVSQLRRESKIVQAASRNVFTTPSALRDYAVRYPDLYAEQKLLLIENGYDEREFANLPTPAERQPGRPLVLLHSGLLYASGRNPVPFLTALAQLRASKTIDNVNVIFRASQSEKDYARDVQRLGLGKVVTFLPQISYRDALIEQMTADGLLLFQGPQFDRQVPAKLYEYLRVGRPIFALTGDQGDTANVLRNTGGAEIAPIDDVEAIASRLATFIQALQNGRAPVSHPAAVARYSRQKGAVLLAEQFDQIIR